MHVVERYSEIDRDHILYEATICDPDSTTTATADDGSSDSPVHVLDLSALVLVLPERVDFT
jgi:hypothetical protein